MSKTQEEDARMTMEPTTESRGPRWSSASGKVMLKHFIRYVAEQEEGSPIMTALHHEGINIIFQLLHLSDDVINNIGYTTQDEQRQMIPLRKDDKGTLVMLIAYIRYLLDHEDFDLAHQWDEVQAADFNKLKK